MRLIYSPLGGLIGCLCIGLILRLVNAEWLNRFLSAAGKYLFEIYLIHIFMKNVYLHYVLDTITVSRFRGVVGWCIIMSISAVLGVLVHKDLGKLKSMKHSGTCERLFSNI